jgi:hypothetical protein
MHGLIITSQAALLFLPLISSNRPSSPNYDGQSGWTLDFWRVETRTMNSSVDAKIKIVF